MNRIITFTIIAAISIGGMAARGLATHSNPRTNVTLTEPAAGVTVPLSAANSGNATSPGEPEGTVIKIVAKKFDFVPDKVTVKKGQPVTLEITAADRAHGFSLPDFKVARRIEPGKATTVTFTPDKAGEFTFSCNVFCGSGHEDMAGKLIVTD